MSQEQIIPPYQPTLANLLHYACEHYGERDFLDSSEGFLTFRSLEERSRMLAKQFIALGISKGTRVGLLMPNVPAFPLIFMAATRIGAIVIPISTLYQARELSWVVRHADINTLIVAPDYLGHNYLQRLEQAFPELESSAGESLYLKNAPFLRQILVAASSAPKWGHSIEKLAPSNIDDGLFEALENEVTPSDWAFIVYTSGSTADPKGVVHTHGNTVRHSYQIANNYLFPQAGDRLLSLRPFFWVAGLSAKLLCALQAGFCLVVPEDTKPQTYLSIMVKKTIDFVDGNKATYAEFNRVAKTLDNPLRLVQLSTDFAGVARQSANVSFNNERLEAQISAEKAIDTLDLMPVMYGMTETSSGFVSFPAGSRIPKEKKGVNGKPVPGSLLVIVNPESRAALLPGEIGEVLAGGYSLMAGLYKKERHETFEEPVLYPTGDLASVDEDGWMTFSARAGEMIKISGANVAPLEVETVLNDQDLIKESAVFGIEKEGDAQLVAVVIPYKNSSIDEVELRSTLKGQLSSFKVPQQIIVVAEDKVPRTGTEKIKKLELLKMLNRGLLS